MRQPNLGFMIVTGYVIVGSLLMLASVPVGSFLKRLSERFASYMRVAMLTFGACVVVLGEFGVALYTVALMSRS